MVAQGLGMGLAGGAVLGSGINVNINSNNQSPTLVQQQVQGVEGVEGVQATERDAASDQPSPASRKNEGRKKAAANASLRKVKTEMKSISSQKKALNRKAKAKKIQKKTYEKMF